MIVPIIAPHLILGSSPFLHLYLTPDAHRPTHRVPPRTDSYVCTNQRFPHHFNITFTDLYRFHNLTHIINYSFMFTIIGFIYNCNWLALVGIAVGNYVCGIRSEGM